MELVAFEAGAYTCALDVRLVREVLPTALVTRVPTAPPAWRGVLNLRGAVIPALDLGLRLGGAPADGPLVIVDGAAAGTCALLVERVLGIRDVEEALLRTPPAELLGAAARLVRHVVAAKGDRDLLVLDLERLLDLEEIKRVAPAPKAARSASPEPSPIRTSTGAGAVASAGDAPHVDPAEHAWAARSRDAPAPSPAPPVPRLRLPARPEPVAEPSPPAPSIGAQAQAARSPLLEPARRTAPSPAEEVERPQAQGAPRGPGLIAAPAARERASDIAGDADSEPSDHAAAPPLPKPWGDSAPPAPRQAQRHEDRPWPSREPVRSEPNGPGSAGEIRIPPALSPILERRPAARTAVPARPGAGEAGPPAPVDAALPEAVPSSRGRPGAWIAASAGALLFVALAILVLWPRHEPLTPRREPGAAKAEVRSSAPPPAAEPPPASAAAPPRSSPVAPPPTIPASSEAAAERTIPVPPAPPAPERGKPAVEPAVERWAVPVRPPASSAPSPAMSASPDRVVVEQGDTLWGLSRRYRGNSLEWPRLYDANRTLIADPDLIYPGQRLIVAPP